MKSLHTNPLHNCCTEATIERHALEVDEVFDTLHSAAGKDSFDFIARFSWLDVRKGDEAIWSSAYRLLDGWGTNLSAALDVFGGHDGVDFYIHGVYGAEGKKSIIVMRSFDHGRCDGMVELMAVNEGDPDYDYNGVDEDVLAALYLSGAEQVDLAPYFSEMLKEVA